MESIAARAKSYVKGCELQGKEARKAEFDYIAGAKEEYLLLTEWRNGEDISPEVGKRVLCKTHGGEVFIGFKRTDGRWSLVGTGLIGEDRYISWRPIHEYELPKYYGDDDGRQSNYTVWVGGTEVTDHLLPKCVADSIAEDWRERGYDDVVVEPYE